MSCAITCPAMSTTTAWRWRSRSARRPPTRSGRPRAGFCSRCCRISGRTAPSARPTGVQRRHRLSQPRHLRHRQGRHHPVRRDEAARGGARPATVARRPGGAQVLARTARRRSGAFWVCGTDPGNLPEAGARSSVVELWFYTPAVGGSIPSAPTKKPPVRTGANACRRCTRPTRWLPSLQAPDARAGSDQRLIRGCSRLDASGGIATCTSPAEYAVRDR